MPNLVSGVVAVEPDGPPFGHLVSNPTGVKGHLKSAFKFTPLSRQYGLTDVPLTFDPPLPGVQAHGQCQHFQLAALPGYTMQGLSYLQLDTSPFLDIGLHPQFKSSPLRKLVNLARFPHVVVTSEASSHGLFDWATVDFLKQAGVDASWLKLAGEGVRGNGHLCFLETNSSEVANRLGGWICQYARPPKPSRNRRMKPSTGHLHARRQFLAKNSIQDINSEYHEKIKIKLASPGNGTSCTIPPQAQGQASGLQSISAQNGQNVGLYGNSSTGMRTRPQSPQPHQQPQEYAPVPSHATGSYFPGTMGLLSPFMPSSNLSLGTYPDTQSLNYAYLGSSNAQMGLQSHQRLARSSSTLDADDVFAPPSMPLPETLPYLPYGVQSVQYYASVSSYGVGGNTAICSEPMETFGGMHSSGQAWPFGLSNFGVDFLSGPTMDTSGLIGFNVPVYSADSMNHVKCSADAVHQSPYASNTRRESQKACKQASHAAVAVPHGKGGAVLKSQVAYKAPAAGSPAQNSTPTRTREPPQSPTENVAMSREHRSKTRRSRGGSQSGSVRKRKRTDPATDVAL